MKLLYMHHCWTKQAVHVTLKQLRETLQLTEII